MESYGVMIILLLEGEKSRQKIHLASSSYGFELKEMDRKHPQMIVILSSDNLRN
jgi:hypothetical protein